MMNPIANVYREIQKYVLGDECFDEEKGQTLIRVHNNKLSEMGDLSFSSKAIAWEKKFTDKFFHGFQNEIPNNEEDVNNFLADFLANAKKWEFPIIRIELLASRFLIFFDREIIIPKVIQMVLDDVNGTGLYGHLLKKPGYRIYRLPMKSDDKNSGLTYYRANLINKVLDRVLEFSEWNIVENSACDSVLQVQVQSVLARRTSKDIDSNVITVLCGIVIDSNGKLSNIDTAEYIKLREKDLNLMAMHKYGIRSKDDEAFNSLISRLGKAAVTVDLLEKKCSSPAPIIKNGLGSNTKGACFILYNSARLETLLKTFDSRVKDGIYSPLPPLKDIDFSLLNNEEEWQLIYVFIFGFPDLIERCLRQLESGQFSAHLIVQFLSGFVGLFSVYYRRIRILTEYRPQLMPQLYARIYLLKALRDVFNKTLYLLDIEPVSHM